jgi:NAD(P)H-dependent FMN reductase
MLIAVIYSPEEYEWCEYQFRGTLSYKGSDVMPPQKQ